ncbi:hypothetical protein BS50DRAFT_618778 [Corynespora cassiicola Philippines]|uniref:Uncharacterized protein n=1 Tax=Corynespora cassiicola Philippines TaxID=1448308 RepID=A0A2T2NWY9_CORCC|nr:hypothetical protein BS50DRAFT_618778 [Corynespora cassiicola Philippines]
MTYRASLSARSFHNSVRRLEDAPSNPSSSSQSSGAPRQTRRVRNTDAFQRIAGLNQNKDEQPARRGPVGGSSRSGVVRTVSIGSSAPGSSTPRGPRSPNTRDPNAPAPPPGKLVRGPSNPRAPRTTPGGAKTPRGPNLRARDGARPPKPGNRPQGGPRKRDRDTNNAANAVTVESSKIDDDLSDGMVQHLLRLQRKQWDRFNYEPKYAHGSEEAKELVQAGKDLFKGEVPTVKTVGTLERRLGVVGMYGAETRVPKYPTKSA